ncbi:MAG: hypothetical protein KGN02_05165 [bacterium]|nr:hypothetical protein [bacterium]
MNVLHLLLPSARELERVAERETDPRHARAFEPLAIGPFFTICALAGIAVLAMVLAIPRILVRLLWRRA